MPTRGMYDTWISGTSASDVNSFCCYGISSIPSGFLRLVVFEKPTSNRSSFTFTFTFALALAVVTVWEGGSHWKVGT